MLKNTQTMYCGFSNRWGKKVFDQTNYDNTWDGENLSDGTYFYIFQLI